MTDINIPALDKESGSIERMLRNAVQDIANEVEKIMNHAIAKKGRHRADLGTCRGSCLGKRHVQPRLSISISKCRAYILPTSQKGPLNSMLRAFRQVICSPSLLKTSA